MSEAAWLPSLIVLGIGLAGGLAAALAAMAVCFYVVLQTEPAFAGAGHKPPCPDPQC